MLGEKHKTIDKHLLAEVLTHPQLPKGPKCGSKYAAEEEGVRVRSLAHNT